MNGTTSHKLLLCTFSFGRTSQQALWISTKPLYNWKQVTQLNANDTTQTNQCKWHNSMQRTSQDILFCSDAKLIYNWTQYYPLVSIVICLIRAVNMFCQVRRAHKLLYDASLRPSYCENYIMDVILKTCFFCLKPAPVCSLGPSKWWQTNNELVLLAATLKNPKR